MSGFKIAQLPWLLDTTGRPIGVKMADGSEVMLPSFSDDGLNLAGAEGKVFPLSKSPVRNGLVIVGDSIAMRNLYGPGCTVVDNGNGTATASGSDLQAYTGDIVSMMGITTSAKLNQLRTPVLSHTLTGTLVTSFTYATTGLYVPNTPSGTTPIVQLDRYESDLGFIGHARARTGARFRVLAVLANGGASSDDIAVVMQTALALNPLAILFQIGTNNVWAKQWDSPTSIASIKKLADITAAAGVIPLFNVIPPRINQATTLSASRTAPVNSWLKTYVRNAGGFVADAWMKTVNGVPFADITSNIGLASANFLDGTDDTHPIRYGGLAQSKALEPILSRIFPAEYGPKYNPLNYAANMKSFFDNTLMLTISGAPTAGTATSGTTAGQLPSGMSTTSTSGTTQNVTTSVIPRTEAEDGEAVGNKLRVVVTGAPSGAVILTRIALTPPGWVHGDILEGIITVRTSSGNTPGTGTPFGMTNPDLLLGVSTTLTGQNNSYACKNQNTGLPIDEAETRVLATPQFPFKWQGAATHGTLSFIRLDLQMFFRAANGHATIDISLPMVNGVPAI